VKNGHPDRGYIGLATPLDDLDGEVDMGPRSTAALTLDDFLALCEAAPEGVRYEAVGGRAVMMSAPSFEHQKVLGRLYTVLERALPASLVVLMAPYDWVLWQVPSLTLRQPDLVVVPDDMPSELRRTTPPVMVVEVLSPTTRAVDLRDKRAEYARAGAGHYWVVDIDAPAVQALALDGTGGYRTVAEAKGDDILTVTDPFPVTVSPADLVRKGGGPWAPKAPRH
jgi:Uma2 family endonuclease